jgi:hypothetical protein
MNTIYYVDDAYSGSPDARDANNFRGTGSILLKNTSAQHMPGNDGNVYTVFQVGSPSSDNSRIQFAKIYIGNEDSNTLYVRTHCNSWSAWKKITLST